MRRKQFHNTENPENVYKTLNDIRTPEQLHENMKSMRPPKSPSLNNYMLPCQMPEKE